MNEVLTKELAIKKAKKAEKMLSLNFILDEYAKLKIVDADVKECTLTIETKLPKEFENLHETIHGGASAWLVDHAMAIVLSTYGNAVHGTTVDMHINYLSPLYANKKITLIAKSVKIGGYLRRGCVDVYCNGVHCLSATGNYTGIKMPHVFEEKL